MYYEIDENFAIRFFNEGNLVPFQFQPDYPNGDPFDSKAEAETWAKLSIAAFEDDKPYAPNGKGLAGEPKTKLAQATAKASANAKLAALGLTAEEIAALTK